MPDGNEILLSNGSAININDAGSNWADRSLSTFAINVPNNTPAIIDVLADDYDVDGGDIITVVSVSDPSAIINPDGTITYTGNALGIHSFSYTIQDSLGASSTGQITVNVSNENIHASTSSNEALTGGWLNDTYHNFIGSFGNDTINDAGGLDWLNLSNHNLASVSWLGLDSNNDTFIDSLKLDFGSGDSITIQNYFDNTSANASLVGAGAGHLEHIIFADNPNVDLQNVQSLLA